MRFETFLLEFCVNFKFYFLKLYILKRFIAWIEAEDINLIVFLL